MTPNLGQGANSAIEGAAALANTLYNLLSKHPPLIPAHSPSLHPITFPSPTPSLSQTSNPNDADLACSLRSFTARRAARVAGIYKTAAFVTRLQARDGVVNKLIGRYAAPYMRDLPADMASRTIMGGVRLDFIDLPQRGGEGWAGVEFGGGWTGMGGGRDAGGVVLLLLGLVLFGLVVAWVVAG
jgi:FAD dependent monooxygenase